MTQNSSTELAVTAEVVKPARGKRIAQMAGAAALSFGLVGTFSLPAYATSPDPEGLPDGFVTAQTLETSDTAAAIIPVADVQGEVGSEIVEQERAAKEAEEAAKVAAEKQAAAEAQTGTAAASATAAAAPAAGGADVPAGSGAQGMVDAAYAQLGQFQDCTALVERSLRAVGIPAGDLGTQIGEYTALGGTLVTGGSYAPGDVLIWSGRHVALYVGNGQAVHGGYAGNQTVVAGAFIDGAPDGVVRFG